MFGCKAIWSKSLLVSKEFWFRSLLVKGFCCKNLWLCGVQVFWLVVGHAHHLAEVRGWWSAMRIILLRSGLVVGQAHHLAEVRGWWSAMRIILLRSGLVVGHAHHLAEVRGWWSAMHIILLRSGVGGQPCTSSC